MDHAARYFALAGLDQRILQRAFAIPANVARHILPSDLSDMAFELEVISENGSLCYFELNVCRFPGNLLSDMVDSLHMEHYSPHAYHITFLDFCFSQYYCKRFLVLFYIELIALLRNSTNCIWQIPLLLYLQRVIMLGNKTLFSQLKLT